MQKLLSVLLAALMLFTMLPVSLVSAEGTEQSTYWLDRDAKDGYVGNYTLLSNHSYQTANGISTGDLSGSCYTEEITEDAETNAPTAPKAAETDENGVIRMTVATDEEQAADIKEANQTHKVGEVSYWFYLADAYQMYEPYVEVMGTQFTCRAEGEHCYVWAETHTEGTAIRIPEAEAKVLADEFDRVYASATNNFGAFDSSLDTKVNILVHNLSDGVSSYFYKFEYESIGNNGRQYMFHVDNFSTMIDNSGTWNVENGFNPMLSAFVDMIIYLRAGERTPIWLAQVMRQAAIPMVYGDSETEKRIENWESATEPYTNGKSIYQWEKADLSADPTYLYMFAQYLKVQYGNYEVFGIILDNYAQGSDNTGEKFIPAALVGTNLEGLSLAQIVEAYRIALVVKCEKTYSMHGFCGKALYDDIPVTYYTGTGLSLTGGGAVLVKNLESGIFTAPEDMDALIGITGITIDIDALPTVNNVVFVDYDGTLLKEELVFSGNDATAPKDPYREGYTFIGWDKDFTNVQQSMTVTAQYEQGETYHTITLINEDNGQVIDTFEVIRSFAPEMPENPSYPGYAFIGWFYEDGNLFDASKPIYEDTTVYARFITAVTIYSYTFTGYTFSSFSTENPSEMNSHSEIDNNVRLLFAGAYFDGYVYGFNDLNNFVKVDAQTFVSEVVSEGATVNANVYRCLDMTYDYVTRTMWISYVDGNGKGNIGKVNLETGKITAAAATSTYIMGIACNKEGKLFGMLPDGMLVTINTSNGRYAEVGRTGVSLQTNDGMLSYTAMTFDYNTGYLYWPVSVENSDETRTSTLYLVDTTDASLTSLGQIANNYTLHAPYIPYTYDVDTYYTVNFVDYDGTILSTQRVKEGESAVAPEDPTREGYRFTGWDKDFTNVTSDLRVMATYEALPVYTVTFADWDLTVISTQQVYEGASAVAPENPTREGYTFVGWSQDFTNVTTNLLVVAQYVEGEIQYKTGDVNMDGSVNAGDAVLVLRYSVSLTELTDEQKIFADCNNDSLINAGDAVYILRYAVGLITDEQA